MVVDMCKVTYLKVVKIANERFEYSITVRVAKTLMMFFLMSLVKKMNLLLRKIISIKMKSK